MMNQNKKKKSIRNKKLGSLSSEGGKNPLVHKKNSVSVDKSDIALMMEGGERSHTPISIYSNGRMIQYHLNK